MNAEQRRRIQQWIHTSNFVYNKTVAAIRAGHPVHFQDLRNRLVTANTKKRDPEYQRLDAQLSRLREEKKTSDRPDLVEEHLQAVKRELHEAKRQIKTTWNDGVLAWELETPKDIRAGAVNDVCKAYKTGFANLKAGNVRGFRLGWRKKTDMQQGMVIPKSFIKNREGVITLAPTFLETAGGATFVLGKKTAKKHRQLVIDHDCRLVQKQGQFWLFVPVTTEAPSTRPTYSTYSGVDPGVRTFMTTFGSEGCYEYEETRPGQLEELDRALATLNNRSKSLRKRAYMKRHQKKEHLVDELHWTTIHALLQRNDVLFYGDIQSHDIVRGKKQRTLNQQINNRKYYQFKQRLMFKAVERGKKVFLVKEHYTTQTCSGCGTLNTPGNSKLYHCHLCQTTVGRDVNASKNILMKGMLRCL